MRGLGGGALLGAINAFFPVTAAKALAQDGIMSAIDYEMSLERMPDPKGDRVRIVMHGKFLPYRKY